ncbi:MAG TPA: DinB family protein [Candidatus Dormibacteraeota bacterium]|nr:DinB family protein [Candidatus Dormibacteraeota bacterium]
MGRQDEAARDLEEAAAAVSHFIEACPDAVWHRRVDAEAKTVAAIAYHCALGNDVALGWICQLLARRPVYETGETHDAFNIVEAVRTAGATKVEVSEALRRTTERSANFLRELTDEELERGGMFGVAGRETTVGRFIANFGRHMRIHLESLEQALQD